MSVWEWSNVRAGGERVEKGTYLEELQVGDNVPHFPELRAAERDLARDGG